MGSDRRSCRIAVITGAAMALLATAFSLVASSAKAQDVTRHVREGQVLAMSSNEITIQEDGTGKQTYSLGLTGLWTLNAQGVVMGDRIRYTVYMMSARTTS